MLSTTERPYGAVANPLQVDLVFADGRTTSVPFDGLQAALRDRATADSTGMYAVSTLRVPLPSWAAGAGVRQIVLTGNGDADARFDVRAIDIATMPQS